MSEEGQAQRMLGFHWREGEDRDSPPNHAESHTQRPHPRGDGERTSEEPRGALEKTPRPKNVQGDSPTLAPGPGADAGKMQPRPPNVSTATVGGGRGLACGERGEVGYPFKPWGHSSLFRKMGRGAVSWEDACSQRRGGA